ncbi:MAG: RHS repeat protein, partial [Sphingomonadales bacterium]|nr:RHS repeat protein [Sphingomonadales bacterium]
MSFASAYALISQNDVNANYTQYDARNLAVQTVEEGRQLSDGGILQTLTSGRSYNAFGEVTSETNALGATVNYRYNNAGKMTRTENPTVLAVLENGAELWIRPAQDYYYDASGRMVAMRDANVTDPNAVNYAANGTQTLGASKAYGTGNLTRMTLLAGTGYGGSEAVVLQEIHADGGVKNYGYDVHGDKRKITDEIGRVSTMIYDKQGRVTQNNQAGGLINYYAYDGLGQQIKHWNNFLTTYNFVTGTLVPDVETTDYDTQGRIISQRSFGGDLTTTSYTWDSSIAAVGGIVTGGWSQVTSYYYGSVATGRTLTEKTDVYGRATYKNDLGSNITTYAYDIAGRMTAATTNGRATKYTYFNTGQLARIYKLSSSSETVIPAQYAQPIGTITHNYNTGVDYAYDKLGQRLSEVGSKITTSFASTATVVAFRGWSSNTQTSTTQEGKNQSASYDALGRLTNWAEVGTTNAPAASIAYQYDAVGNIRHTTSTNPVLSAKGAVTSNKTENYWFRFDSMNRLVTDRGILSGTAGAVGTTVVRNHISTLGEDILYNAAGERVAVLTTTSQYTGNGYMAPPTAVVYYENRESYYYDDGGRLSHIFLTKGAGLTASFNTITGPSLPSVPLPSAFIPPKSATDYQRSIFGYDLMGRQISQNDYEADGRKVAYDRTASYNAKSQLISDDVSTKRGNDTFRSVTSYDYDGTADNASQYALGQATSVSSVNYKNQNDGDAPDTLTTNTYYWRDGAVQATIKHNPD